jgi:hypothetical protein
MNEIKSVLNPVTGAKEFAPEEVYGQFHMQPPMSYKDQVKQAEAQQMAPAPKLTQRDSNIKSSLLSIENFDHYMNVAMQLSKSTLIPKHMIGKPADVLIAMECGLQLGIPMLQAIQDIAVINGKPTLYGDGLLAAVQGHKDYEYIKEHVTKDAGDAKKAVCIMKRKNHDERVVEFSVADAKKAALWGKAGPWSQYPDRMLQMRARAFCIRDLFADALRGIKTEEEVTDYVEVRTKSNPVLEMLKPTMVTTAQLEIIAGLIDSTGISNDRISKARTHFNVSEFKELTEGQANEFISMLNREASR